jgi:hypothetical protein
VFAGADLLGENADLDRIREILSLTSLLPLNIETRSRVDTDRGTLPRLALISEAKYDTHKAKWEGKVGLTYVLARNISLIGQWHSDYEWGAGTIIRF